MKFIKSASSGSAVRKLQFYLSLAGYPLAETGVFDSITETAVKEFQKKKSLDIDGKVGNMTWAAIFKNVYKDDFFSDQIINSFLQADEYYHDVLPKNAIYLHHTAGNFNPKSTLRWWETDHYNSGASRHICTPFCIGRRSSIVGKENTEYDGVTYRCFNEINWAHHLGVRDNYKKDKSTVGIEICAFGWLYKDDGGFYYQADKEKNTRKVYLKEEEVHQFENPWRGKSYFEKYTEKQIAETKRLILTLAYLFDIELPDREYSKDWFSIQNDALEGKPGIWTHVNVRKDKTDCFPQPELIDMLNTLHKEQKDFKPILKESDRVVEEPEPVVVDSTITIETENTDDNLEGVDETQPQPVVETEPIVEQPVVEVLDNDTTDVVVENITMEAETIEVVDRSVSANVPAFEMHDLFRINEL